MRLQLIFGLSFALMAAAQPRPGMGAAPVPPATRGAGGVVFRGVPPARGPGYGARPGYYPGGGYYSPWSWWMPGVVSEPSNVPKPPPPEPEKQPPLFVQNKDYQREKVQLSVTEYADGVLAAPAFTARGSTKVEPCLVSFRDGTKATAVSCDVSDEWIVYSGSDGRRVRVTRDLASAQPDSPVR